MHNDLETLREELEVALGGLDQQQTQLRPAGRDDKWNTQQIMGHLLLTYAVTELAMDARIAKGAGTKAAPSVAQRVGQFALLRVGYFPRGRTAPGRVTAAPDAAAVPGGILIAQAETALGSMDRKIAAAEAIFGPNRRAISHMVLGPLSAMQWRRFHLVHGRHHIKQIVAIRRTHSA